MCYSSVSIGSEYHGLADTDLAAAGIPSMAQYIDMYCTRRGIPARINPFFIAYGDGGRDWVGLLG